MILAQSLDMSWITTIGKLISEGGWLVVMVLVLWTGYKQMWLFGGALVDLREQLQAVRKDRDEWKALSIELLRQQRTLVEITEAKRPVGV